MKRIVIAADAKLWAYPSQFGLSELTARYKQIEDSINGLASKEVLKLDHRSFPNGQDPLGTSEKTPIAGLFLFGHGDPARLSTCSGTWFEDWVTAHGGRAFATGDHSDLGAALSSNLFGFASLRNWQSPPSDKPNSVDTRPIPGREELDAHAKPIHARWFNRPAQTTVHPLLNLRPGEPIQFLADHAHEGELAANSQLDGWDVLDLAYHVVRRFDQDYQPTLAPVLRIAEQRGKGGRLAVDTTIHHWTSESWAVLPAAQREHVHAYADNMLLYLLPDDVLLLLANEGVRLGNAHAGIREVQEDDRKGLLASRLVARTDAFLWRAMRMWDWYRQPAVVPVSTYASVSGSPESGALATETAAIAAPTGSDIRTSFEQRFGQALARGSWQ